MKRFIRCLLLLLGVGIACGILYTTPSNWSSESDSHATCAPISHSPVAENLFLLTENFNTVALKGPTFLFINPDGFAALDSVIKFGNAFLDVDKMYDGAMAGGFESLAGLALVSRLEAAGKLKVRAKAPALDWEDKLTSLLGEKEGNYILGLIASQLIEDLPAHNTTVLERAEVLARVAAEALRQGAKAGHVEAMYGLMLYADRFPDPDFRMPDTPGFPIATQAMLDESFTPEMLYWLGKAAANGSSRANLRMGLAFIDPKDKRLQNIPVGLDFIKKSVAQGSAAAAQKLSAYMDPRYPEADIPNASCAQTLHYFALAERMGDENGLLWREKPGRTGLDESSYLDTLFIKMNQGLAGFEQCLTEEEYRAILAETKTEHTAIRIELEAKKGEREALYEQAKARLR